MKIDQRKIYPRKRRFKRGKLLELRMARKNKNVSVPVSCEGKTEEYSMCFGDCIDSDRDRLPRKTYCSLCTDTASYGFNTVPIESVTVHLARRGFQDRVVYCLLPPTLVYFAVLQPGLFSVYCLIHCITTRTTFNELPQALC